MPVTSQPLGRRERNKREKLDRITAAASELFAEFGVEDVTTQQIADKADIGTGTLFLYARNKGELLLLVQNVHYAEALERGRTEAQANPDALGAVMSIVRPIVECNRVQIDNGRFYLREMVFGDPTETHHNAALSIVGQTEEAIAEILGREKLAGAEDAATAARIVSAIMFVSLAASVNAGMDIEALERDIRTQISLLIRR
ncbi:TetR/AcrR family transcriptional regulator [Pseudarthrobacter sp. SL88]|uniref:TetR/AcrR family transcriptional regulator n=1 Tax=Pseudarthrobacter sp. SL88 TaxID=2994666 RepID=UPI002276525D|nr:TetR/AcrR family transcriptional regulator [Pseudarthrobacter sp. SL88]MCY1674920.1 TetR/AcrR family transcriptional regulator [Pseudarthrobacter sp. SL88]